MMLRMSLFSCAVLLLTALGCTNEPAPTSDSGAASSPKPTSAPAKSPRVSLAPAGEATPPLDGGRVQSNMPEGWKFLPRSNDYLFAAYYEDKSGIPRLVLRESDGGDLPDTSSADTAKQSVTKITEEVGADKDAAITVVNVGSNWFVRYEKAMKFRGLAANGVFLETVRSGKRYSIELLVYSVDKEKFLPALYRFAADLKIEATEKEEATTEEPEESSEPTEEGATEEGSTEPSDDESAASDSSEE